jgi:hypothetical protein
MNAPLSRDEAKQQIIAALSDGPHWARSFQAAKPLLNELIREGTVERCKPVGGRANNMVRIAAQGREMDRFAEALSETGTVAAAARAVGVCYEHGKKLYRQICAELGPQAAL